MKSKIICHMISSVDGRLWIERFSPLYGENVPANYSTDLYLQKNIEQKADAWIVGKTSVQELAFPGTLDFSKEAPTTNFETYAADRKTKKAVVVFDSKGSIDFTSNTIMEDELIVVLGETVSDKYLAYLRERNISYLFAGAQGKDLNLALKILSETFGLNIFTLVGGGTINGAFLKAGLIDELLLQLYPGVDGLAGVPAIFEYHGKAEELPAKGQQLELLDIEKKEHGIVYLRYRFHKA